MSCNRRHFAGRILPVLGWRWLWWAGVWESISICITHDVRERTLTCNPPASTSNPPPECRNCLSNPGGRLPACKTSHWKPSKEFRRFHSICIHCVGKSACICQPTIDLAMVNSCDDTWTKIDECRKVGALPGLDQEICLTADCLTYSLIACGHTIQGTLLEAYFLDSNCICRHHAWGWHPSLFGELSRYLHHAARGELQHDRRVFSVHTLIKNCRAVWVAILAGKNGCLIRAAEELLRSAHEHIVVEQGEGTELAPQQQDVLLVQVLLGNQQLACMESNKCCVLAGSNVSCLLASPCRHNCLSSTKLACSMFSIGNGACRAGDPLCSLWIWRSFQRVMCQQEAILHMLVNAPEA